MHYEVQDSRTWKTQYQIIMAIGECGCQAALPTLEALTQHIFEAPIVYLALGDAIVRLQRDGAFTHLITDAMHAENNMLLAGAMRAVAMLHLRLDCTIVASIINYATQGLTNDRAAILFFYREEVHLWLAAGAARWDCPTVPAFLQWCLHSDRQDVQRAARASLQKTYLKWRPL